MRGSNATVINGKVYCGGDTNGTVYCYDPSQDKWTGLPPLPVESFGVGQVNGKLIAVGGEKIEGKQSKSDGKATNEVYTYDERSRKWKQTIPPMPTARYRPGILSLQSALIVAGGCIFTSLSRTDAVEILKADNLQWYRTKPLPRSCIDISMVDFNNTCYVIGGYKYPSRLNQAIYASVDDLFRSAVPANQTPYYYSSNDTESVWKTLPNTPTYRSSAAMLTGNLLVIGGNEASEGGAAKKEIYMYSPSINTWVYVSDLPAPRSCSTLTNLSSTEILIIGGCIDGCDVNTVYKGILSLD